jgi:hypothetical protein
MAAVVLGFTGWSAVTTYGSIWLADQVRLSGGLLTVTFVITGIFGALGSLCGHQVLVRWRPRPAMIICSLLQGAISVTLFGRSAPVPVAVCGIALITLLQPVRGVAQRSGLAGSVAPESREHAFAMYRMAMNAGVFAGPIVMSLLLLRGWGWAHAGIAVMFCLAALSSFLVPAPGVSSTRESRRLRSLAGNLISDPRLRELLIVTTGAWTLISGVEIVLPAVLTSHHEFPEAAWGFAYAAAAAAVVVLQPSASKLASGTRTTPRLLLGVTLLGLGFVPEFISAGVVPLVITLMLFACGDLVWGPPSEEIAVALAPTGAELHYIAVSGASIWIGESIAALIGFLTDQYLAPDVSYACFLVTAVFTGIGYKRLSRPPSRTVTAVPGLP